MNTFEFLRPGVSKQLSPKCLCGTVFSLSRSLSPFFTRSSFSHSLYHAIVCHSSYSCLRLSFFLILPYLLFSIFLTNSLPHTLYLFRLSVTEASLSLSYLILYFLFSPSLTFLFLPISPIVVYPSSLLPSPFSTSHYHLQCDRATFSLSLSPFISHFSHSPSFVFSLSFYSTYIIYPLF